jgi:hypothetical protein
VVMSGVFRCGDLMFAGGRHHFSMIPLADEAAKVRVHFKAVAGAPILKKNKFLIPSSEPFGTVHYLEPPVVLVIG